jgi:hypothetical protein
MSWLTNIFSGGIDKVIGSVGKVIDDLHTSDEEKLILKDKMIDEMNRFSEVQLNAIADYDKEITSRHANDMKSDSWLSKNIRPLTLAFLTLSTVLLAYLTIFRLPVEKVDLLKPWTTLLTTLDVTAFTFYFGSRGIEKIKSMQK